MVLQRTILIVEDSPLQAIVLRRFLQNAGYLVVTAKDGVDALETIPKHPIALVISDINMPKMNGFELCRSIKSSPTLWQLPVILCTALSTPNDLIMGIEVGADNYIAQPWNDQQLLSIINELLSTPPRPAMGMETEVVKLRGQEFKVSTSRQYILNFLLSTYENLHQQNQELNHLKAEILKAYKQLENVQKEQEQILYKIFPESVAQELLAYGTVSPRRYEDATVMFVDFKGFTQSAKDINAQTLVEALGHYFETFDGIIEKYKLERIKTIGDGYMCVGGVPEYVGVPVIDTVKAALEIRQFVLNSKAEMKEKYQISWDARIGINTGPVVAGVIGKKRPAYDIWGGTVNLASRMESHCEVNQVNISEETYQLVKDYFLIKERGKIAVRNKEGIEMYVEMYYVEAVK